MDKKLIARLEAAARKNAEKLTQIENNEEYLKKVERYQRASQISVESLHKQFNI